MKMNEKIKLREALLIKQDNKCAICKFGAWCAACKIEVLDNDIVIIGTGKCRFFHKGYTEHHIQTVNTLDHNHSHIGCEGCEKCIRGMTHDRCNRALNILFEGKNNEQISHIIEYVKIGEQSLK